MVVRGSQTERENEQINNDREHKQRDRQRRMRKSQRKERKEERGSERKKKGRKRVIQIEREVMIDGMEKDKSIKHRDKERPETRYKTS